MKPDSKPSHQNLWRRSWASVCTALPHGMLGLRTRAEDSATQTFPLESSPSAQGHRMGREDLQGSGSQAGGTCKQEMCSISYLNANSWCVFTLIKNVVNDWTPSTAADLQRWVLLLMGPNWLIAWFPNVRSSNVMSGCPRGVWVSRGGSWRQRSLLSKGLKSGWRKGRWQDKHTVQRLVPGRRATAWHLLCH